MSSFYVVRAMIETTDDCRVDIENAVVSGLLKVESVRQVVEVEVEKHECD